MRRQAGKREAGASSPKRVTAQQGSSSIHVSPAQRGAHVAGKRHRPSTEAVLHPKAASSAHAAATSTAATKKAAPSKAPRKAAKHSLQLFSKRPSAASEAKSNAKSKGKSKSSGSNTTQKTVIKTVKAELVGQVCLLRLFSCGAYLPTLFGYHVCILCVHTYLCTE